MKTTPYKHQLKVWKETREFPGYGLFWEMGAGKSKTAIDTIAHLYGIGQIEAVVILAPNGVHRNWIVKEIPIHMWDNVQYRAAYHRSSPNKKERTAVEKLFEPGYHGLRIYAVNSEALSRKTSAVRDSLRVFINTLRCALIVDESSKFKTPGSQRTKAAIAMSLRCPFKRILSGTPVSQGPLDLFAQFQILEKGLLGYRTFSEFRHEFAITEPRQREISGGRMVRYDEVVGYQNMDQLRELIAPHMSRVLKKDCLDLPPKIYETRPTELTKEQRRMYRQMLDESVTTLCDELEDPPAWFKGSALSLEEQLLLLLNDENSVVASHAAVRVVRLQQIIGGFATTEDGEVHPINPVNPRITTLMDLLEEIGAGTVVVDNGSSFDGEGDLKWVPNPHGKVIIWARFKAELRAIYAALEQAYGDGVVVGYWGDIKQRDRDAGVDAFTDPRSPVRFFVGQVHAGGYGLTLTTASTVVYFSNDYSLEARLQSEDRAHRIGQTKPVTYVDIIAEGTVDVKISASLQAKQEVATMVLD